MTKALFGLLGLITLVSTLGCAYGAAAPMGTDKVIIARNTILGADTVYVCTVTEAGVSDCKEAESP